MSPETMRRIEDALTRLPPGARFSSRTRLSEFLAVSTGLSSRTIRRAFDRLDVNELIEPGHLPAVGQPVRISVRHVGQPPDSDHETPGHADDAGSPSRARTHASPGTPTPAPAAPPAAPPPPPPSVRTGDASSSGDPSAVKLERMLKRSRRMVNKFGGYCVCCGEWVDSGEGWIPHPYPVDEPTPLHCPPCWDWFDAIDRELSSSADIPDQANESKGTS